MSSASQPTLLPSGHTSAEHPHRLRGSQRLAIRIALGALAAIWLGASASPSIYPVGTTRFEHERAYPVDILFTGGDGKAHLIDMEGRSLHEWPDLGSYSTLLDPALTAGQRGHVLVTLEQAEGKGIDLVPGRIGSRISQTIAELDWGGTPVWRFGAHAPGGLAQQHHDYARLPNGNTLVLSNWVHAVPGYAQPRILDDVFYEVDPKGDIVWRWVASEHVQELGFTAQQLKLVLASDNADILHVNDLKPVGPNHWFDAGDTRFAPNNVIFCSRNGNFTAIVSRDTGKVVWTLGPNYPKLATGVAFKHLPRPVDQISGQHDAQIIPAGLPGAGNLLLFDNQGEAGFPAVPLSVTGGSRVIEIDPVRKEIVWQYSAEDSGQPSWAMRSTHISSARRLPNGNTFIDEGQSGRVFQVTRSGDIVWEYVNAYPKVSQGDGARTIINPQLYRAEPVPLDWVPQ